MKRRSATVLLLVLLYGLLLIKTAWLGDDAFITLRTVDNFVNGYGLVWNIGERVQAYTHPLWMFLLSAVIFITRETYYSTLVVSMGIACVAVLLIAYRTSLSSTNAALALLVLILSKAFVEYSTSGLETPLTFLIIVLFLHQYFRWIQSQPTTPLTDRNAEMSSSPYGHKRLLALTFIAALGIVNRMDLALLFLPMLAYAYWQKIYGQGTSIKDLWHLGLGFLPLFVWEAFSLLYYGFLFPNTAYAKLNTGIPRMELVQQGFLYLLNTIAVDPITPLIVVIGIILPLALKQYSTLRPLSMGIGLYLLYTIWIGGDFMVGRFLAPPFVVAVIALSRIETNRLKRADLVGVALILGAVGMLNPSQSPILSPLDYEISGIHSSGIADERGFYYKLHGLLKSDRQNRLVAQGYITGEPSPYSYVVRHAAGIHGFASSRHTYIVDSLALADPLLARLPARVKANWRPGHMRRAIPPGYEESINSGENLIADPQLAAYYDKLRLVTQGSLWDANRLRVIGGFLLGRYEHLIDREAYRYFGSQQVEAEDAFSNSAGEAGWDSAHLNQRHMEFPSPLAYDDAGILVEWGDIVHATHLDMATELEHYEVRFYLDNRLVGKTTVAERSLRLGAQPFSIMSIPNDVAEAGFDRTRIVPRQTSHAPILSLSLLSIHNPPFLDLGQRARTNINIESLAHLYVYTYYRLEGPQRAEQLALLNRYILETAPSEWEEISADVIADLLRIPERNFHAAILERRPE